MSEHSNDNQGNSYDGDDQDSSDDIQSLGRQLKQQSEDIDNALQKFNSFIKGYSENSSGYLTGVVGGAVGGSIGLVFSTYLGGLAIIAGPAGIVIGAAITILLWRGLPYQRLEREIEKSDLILNNLEKRLKGLPPDAPAHVRDKLWKQYSDEIISQREKFKNDLDSTCR